MPKMDGFEACRRLRAEEVTKETPIIMVTTRGEVENVEHGYELGCTDYVPFKHIGYWKLYIVQPHREPNT